MNVIKTLAAAALASAALTGGAFAATIATGDKSVDITCTGSCQFWDLGDGSDGFSPTTGDWLSAAYGGLEPNGNGNGNASNSAANRIEFVNNVLGTEFTSQSETSDGDLDDVSALDGFSGGDDAGWTGSSQFYLAWGGFDPRYVLIRNDSADNTFSWTNTGQGSGLSGVDGFGEVAPIPLPAGGLLLIGGLGGLAALRRKRR